MAEFNGFHELGEELSALAEEFREENPTMKDPDTGQFTSTRGAIQSGINSAMDNIVRESRRIARRHVPGEHADTIDHESLGWVGTDNYFHKFYAESDLVAFHEFGTGTKAEHPHHSGTVNAEDKYGNAGYLIEPPGDQTIAFEHNGQSIVVEYVVHPGVPANHFMQNTLRQNTDLIDEEIANALEQRFDL